MIRRHSAGDTVFATTIEPHGAYSPVTELATDANSSIAKLRIAHDDEDYTAISIEDVDGQTSLFILSNRDSASAKRHELSIDERVYRWSGPYHYGQARK